MAPLLESLITEKMLKDEYQNISFSSQDEEGRTNSFDSDKPILILNPTEYTLRENDIEEQKQHSAFAEQQPSKKL